ncbi:hypothetical protein DV451_000830 [Geotrichum candidum]|uniref:Tethering factor for nuclear proteasome STS1 n=1 Tax=Geotrichum candidum TaxID=1173061 RepID=A0A0J9XLN7_GEOCN|nr:hypothetical protein DV451_000830 [Geotrichum candidum]KAI9210014.1 hypothetical protein DS838_005102 [Geotrichum bryndzae]KAF5105309.1 hypothetical protein DV452_005174 [Geotrichum candidum]KAF5106573.1 hypothetical protein DV453_003811 [Geotrichum candidum]KAF5120673.1 hypothetical protein DV495_004479 [Geotrichum candidum]
MGTANAILPPSTVWGFSATPAANTPASHFTFNSTLFAQKPLTNKRKHDEPDNSYIYNNNNNNNNNSALPRNVLKIRKRPKVQSLASKPLPISRIIETMDRISLENLVTTLCQHNPGLSNQISALTPAITVSSALECLRSKLETVFLGLPYKGDQQGDYAYLRVKPAIEDFLAAFADYLEHFLPPNESQLSNSLAFLDSATTLLWRLPVWNNAINNHSKKVMFEQLAQAWIVTFQEVAAASATGLGLGYEMWVQKLRMHHEITMELGVAVEFLNNIFAN